MNFRESIELLTRRNRDNDPVYQAKKSLASVKAEAESGLVDFRALCADLAPQINEAQTRQGEAARVGVYSPALNGCLQQIRLVMLGGGPAFETTVNMIEFLTPWEVGQKSHMAAIPGTLRLAQTNAGQLRGLVAALPSHLAELEQLVLARVASRPIPSSTGPIGGVDLADFRQPAPVDAFPRP